MKQQTAIEWLCNELKETYHKERRLALSNIIPLLKQAKAMEKEQIMDAFQYGKINNNKNWADEYYNETYNTHENI